MKKSFSIEQVASQLNCSGQTVRRLIATGRLKSFLFGKRRLVRVEALESYIQQLSEALR
jgi:excisionase family DNA binding protein